MGATTPNEYRQIRLARLEKAQQRMKSRTNPKPKGLGLNDQVLYNMSRTLLRLRKTNTLTTIMGLHDILYYYPRLKDISELAWVLAGRITCLSDAGFIDHVYYKGKHYYSINQPGFERLESLGAISNE